MSRFSFVQIEVPGGHGVADGRYPLRAAGSSSTSGVLATRTFGAPPPARRRFRRPRPKDADADARAKVPVTELTVISADPIEGDADEWLAAIRADAERRDALVTAALGAATRALAARRVSASDSSVPDVSAESALAIRIGYGTGDELAEGHWGAAIAVPREPGRVARREALRPQERMARLIGGREEPLACEELLIRARADLDAGRDREAALQLRVALEALLAERSALDGAGQGEDLAFLDGRRRPTGEAANEALRGPLTAERASEVAETVAACERVLRRRAAHG